MQTVAKLKHKLAIFWRYRHQTNNYEVIKYWGILIFFNSFLTFFYLNFGLWLIGQQLTNYLILLIILHIFTFITMLIIHKSDPGKLPTIKKEIVRIFQDQYGPIPPSNRRIFFGQTYNYNISCQHHLHQIKFCNTCNIFRPNLTFHCNQCKRCVQQMDHHCPWLANCIGKNNYKLFYLHIFFSMFFLISISCFCLYILCDYKFDNIFQRVVSMILCIVSIFSGLVLICLWSIHSYFLIKGISTKIFMRELNKQIIVKQQQFTEPIDNKIIFKQNKHLHTKQLNTNIVKPIKKKGTTIIGQSIQKLSKRDYKQNMPTSQNLLISKIPLKQP